MKPKSGIYKIEHIESGKLYIGSAVNLLNRKATHFSLLRNGLHKNSKLQNAFNKHGEDSFVFSVILYCKDIDLVMYEQKAIDSFNSVDSGYNVLRVAGSALGFKHSESHKESLIGNKRALGLVHTKQAKEKISSALIGNKYSIGAVKPESARMAVSVALKGRKQSIEHVKKRIEAVTIAKRRKKEAMVAENA